MHGAYETNIDVLENEEMENKLLELFGDNYLEDAIRIMSNRSVSPMDNELIFEALAIVIAIYVKKIKSGAINKGKTLH